MGTVRWWCFDYAELGVPYAFAAQPALKAPAPGVPAPAHIAEGKTTGSAPSTPKMTSPAQLVSVPVPAAGSGGRGVCQRHWRYGDSDDIGSSGGVRAGLGLAIPSAAGADTERTRHPRRNAASHSHSNVRSGRNSTRSVAMQQFHGQSLDRISADEGWGGLGRF